MISVEGISTAEVEELLKPDPGTSDED
jgi:hypothetical protein